MYEIIIPETFTRADGKTFRKNIEDGKGNFVEKMDKEGNVVKLPVRVRGQDGQEFTYMQPQYETEDADYIYMLTAFLNNLFDLVAMKAKEDRAIKPLKSEDSGLSYDIFRSMHVANKVIELEKAPKEWLEKMLTEYGVDVFGVNTAVILSPVKSAKEIEPTRAEKKRAN